MQTVPQTYRVIFDPLSGVGPLKIPAPAPADHIAANIREAFDQAVEIDVKVRVDLATGAVTVANEDGDIFERGRIEGPGIPEQPEPDLRYRFAAELHRIADDIVSQQLPLGRVMSASLSPGVLDSRADLDRWATYLGSPVRVDSNGIPFTEAQIRLGKKYGASLAVGAQTRQEHPSEVERLRARVAELEAERGAGGAR